MSLGPLVFCAAAGQLAALLASRRAPRLWLAANLVSSGFAFVAALLILFVGPAWEWRGGPRLGTDVLHLRIDGLSAFFIVLLAVVESCAAVYAREYWADHRHPRSAAAGRTWWSLLVFGLSIVLTVSNGLHFLFGWELFAVAGFFLVALRRDEKEVRAAGSLYLNASHAATLSLFAFFALLAAKTGSWELGPMRDRAEVGPLFWLALFGFGLKAGAFPLHVWLPSAHANAPTHVSAMLSGVTIKIGIYGLMRFSGWLPVPPSAAWTIAGLGAISAVLGVAFALGQHDIKRLLAYHSVENIGIILIGFGFALIAASDPTNDSAAWGRLAMAGALLHVWNHGLFKSLLFLGAGSVLHATGTREMSRLGGLWRAMPWTAALFALGAIAISGLPPLNGFVSEWLVYLGLFDATVAHGPNAWAAVPTAVLLAVTGALALACFVKVCGVVFLGAPRSRAVTRAHECGWRMRGAMIVLAAACLSLGLMPVLFWPALASAFDAWRASAPVAAPASLPVLSGAQVVLLISATVGAAWLWRRTGRARDVAMTWDCGYIEPTARMQYTAGSFAATITDWFRWILRPNREVEVPATPFPISAHFETHTPETILDLVVVPAAALVTRVSLAARRLQHGRLQSYLLYLLVGIAALVCLVMSGGPQ